MGDRNLSTTNEREEHATLSMKFSQTLKRWLAVFSEHYRQPISKVSAVAYGEALCDLTPGQLDMACREAMRTSEFMPVAATIRNALENMDSGEQFLGPRQENYPPVTDEDRAEGVKFFEAFREMVEKKEADINTAKAVILAEDSTYNIEEQLTAYKKWLEEQVEQDGRDRANGLSPLLRTQAERLAMYMSLPLIERRRIAKSGEWTKLNIKPT
jgi:hypothetical protein